MFYYLKLYTATLIVFFAIDFLWIGLVARTFYRKYIGFLLAPSPNWTAAIIFYLLFILGLLFFVVVPGLKENSFKITFLRAALFGLITYSTYDLTNLATLKDWPLLVTAVDMMWGTVLSVAVSEVSFMIGKWLS
jgi:uncharacterized membrane protein